MIALALAIAVAAQGVVLWHWGASAQYAVAGLAAAVTAHQGWAVRRLLPPHADMLLIMLGFGGFGMLAGSWVDSGFGRPLFCHAHGLVSWMTLLMLAGSVPPGVAWSRCLDPLRSRPLRLAAAVLIDTAGMLAGMWLAGRLLAAALGNSHVAMLAGMLAGMALAMPVRDMLVVRKGVVFVDKQQA